MSDWIDVTEAQHKALEGLGAPVRTVHQAKVPKTWDVSKLGGGKPKAGPAGYSHRGRTPSKPTDIFRLGIGDGTNSRWGDSANIRKVWVAIKESAKGDLKTERSRTSWLNTAVKATGLPRDMASANLSQLMSNKYFVRIGPGKEK